MTAVPCTTCDAPTDPLALFPGNVCLACWDTAHRDDTPEQLLADINRVFNQGGR